VFAYANLLLMAISYKAKV